MTTLMVGDLILAHDTAAVFEVVGFVASGREGEQVAKSSTPGSQPVFVMKALAKPSEVLP